MKKILFSLVLLSFSISIFSQKAKIRRKSYKVEYASLPKHKVDQGTYRVDVSGMGSYGIDEGDINLRGWERVDEGDADVKVKVRVNGFTPGSPKKESKTTKSKDKSGKETRTTNYWYTATSRGRGSMKIWGPTNAYVAPKKIKKSKKKKKAPKEREAKKEENPFLTDVEIDEEETEDESTDKAAGFYDMGQEYTYTTAKNSSRSAAYKEYVANAPSSIDNSRDRFYNNMGNRISYQLNDFYGYNRKTEWVTFKRLKSKKHPEHKMFNNATDGIKAIFAKKRFNKNNDQIAGALNPIMQYFEKVASKFSKDDKNHKRLKSAALYNMAQTYLYLDMPDKVLEIASEYKRWGHDADIGESFEEKAKNLQHLLTFHEAKGRFYETEEDPDDVWTEDIGDEPSDEGNE